MSGQMFLDSRAKILRAEAHAQELFEVAAEFTQSKPALIKHEPDPATQDYIFYMDLVEEPPLLEWGTVVGDILHNLRSALDCLAWQLVRNHLQREPKSKEASKVYFPLADHPNAFAAHSLKGLVDSADLGRLEQVQPYQVGFEVLGTLGRLSNRDKHRVVQPAYLMNEDFKLSARPVRDCEITQVITAEPGPFAHRRELGRVKGRNTGPNPEIEGKATLSGYLGLEDGTKLGHLIDEMAQKVTEVIKLFE